jgi:hypothetical protein
MVWGEARAAEQCVDAGAPEITGKAQALLSGRAANDARQVRVRSTVREQDPMHPLSTMRPRRGERLLQG